MLIGALVFSVPLLLEPSSPPKNVFVANVTDQQATISWTTKRATKGAVIVSNDGTFPLLPFLAKKLHKDEGDDNRKQGFYTVHHVTVDGLKPNRSYTFRIYQGLWRAFERSLVTGPILSLLPNPNPVYGRVLQKGKAAVGAVVYLRAKKGNETSSFIATITNPEGRWSLDLANLRTKDLQRSFRLDRSTNEELIVEAGARGRVKTKVLFGQDKPWPDVLLP